MGVLAGYPVREVRRAMQHGHPQLTVPDLFGTPLPSDLVAAKSLADIDVAWRSWLGMRVKIIDEYNRIPTRTQSALLTVLADGYVEVFDQVYETGARPGTSRPTTTRAAARTRSSRRCATASTSS